MEIKTEAHMQRLLNFEGVLILIAIGADIFIEALKNQDWLSAAVIIAGFCIIGGLYWHAHYLDRLVESLQTGMHRILSHLAHAPVPTPPTSTSNVAAATLSDRPLLHVSNFPQSRNFYAMLLGTLGYAMTLEFPALSMAAFGVNGASDFWIKGDGVEEKIRAAFSATDKRMVDDFSQMAIEMGATVTEVPGARPERGTGYYAAAALDPDGYTIEAIFRDTSATA
jgi:catechol 2,3-dioxygenase-like lactoylglutathione lyase family enzyme